MTTADQRQARLDGMASVAGGLAHNINNALAPLLASAGLLRAGLPDLKARQVLGLLSESALKCADMVQQLLVFSGSMDGEFRRLDMRRIALEAAAVLCKAKPEGVALKVAMARRILPVMGDRGQIRQLILNLGMNAIEATAAGGTVKLAVRNSRGRGVVLTVSDTGAGIPSKYRPRLFEPFFTTKIPGQGRGLGLSAVHGIVKSHGGRLSVRSESGKGSKFRIFLPS